MLGYSKAQAYSELWGAPYILTPLFASFFTLFYGVMAAFDNVVEEDHDRMARLEFENQ